MGSESLPRKLAAVLYADVAGYTRLTADNEDSTHRTLSEYLDFIASAIRQHNGRVVHYAGDAVLAMFSAVVDAVRCADEIQKELARRNADLTGDRRVEFRIGVNLGDVIEDREDIFGDGVNVAARLETLASPGGICVSESVRTAVGKRLPLVFEDLGERVLKNVDHPVRAYGVRPAVSATERINRKRAPQLKTVGRIAAIALIVVLVTAWVTDFHGVRQLFSGDTAPLITSIAVLPLDNLSGDPEQEYFADGMTEVLTAELGQISTLTVKSRTSAMQFKHTEKLAPQIARELHVDALLEGSVLRAGDRVRITLQLVDAATDRHLWANSFEEDLRDVLALQRRVARSFAEEVRVRLTPSVRDRLRPVDAAIAQRVDPRAFEAYLQGRYRFNQSGGGLQGFQVAIRHYQQAIALDPTLAIAYAALAEACLQPPILHARALTVDDCEKAAVTAVERDGELAEAHAALGFVLYHRWDWQGSEAEFRRAIDLNPNSAMAHQLYMNLLRITMRFDEALREIKRAEELDPLNLFVKTMVGWPLLSLHRFDDALAQWATVLEMDPDFGLAHYNRGLVHAVRGMSAEALVSARRAAEQMGANAAGVLGLTAVGHALGGDTDSAMRLLADLQREYGSTAIGWIATVHLALGQKEQALAWLEKGLELRSDLGATSEPFWDVLRKEPRFQAIRREMDLP